MPQTMHDACAMIANILATLSPPHIPPSLELLLFLRENGVTVIPATHEEAEQIAQGVTEAYTLFESNIAKYELSWNSKDNKLIPAILRECYIRYGQQFPDCWIDAMNWLATIIIPLQRSIVPLCIAHVLYEASVVEKQAVQLATDAGIAQCLQQEYIRAQIHRYAMVARCLSRS